MKAAQQLRQHLHRRQIPAADGNGPFDQLVLFGQLLLRFVHKLQNLLGTAAQQKPLAGKGNFPRPPVKKPDAHFLLHPGNLAA